MAFTATQKAQIYEILAVPLSGNSVTVTSLVHQPYSNVAVWFPTWNRGNYDGLRAAIDEAIASASTETQALVATILTRWVELGTSPLRVDTGDDGAAGRLVDYEAEREIIRRRLANHLGIAVPEGGYLAEIQRTFGKSCAPSMMTNLNDR